MLWRTAPLDYSNADLVGTILRADGTTATIAISGQTDGDEVSAVAVWDGARFFVAWRYHVMDMGSPPYPRSAPIRARHLTAEGETVESVPFTLHVADNYTHVLKAAPSPRGVVLAWNELREWNGLTAVTRLARYEGAAPLTPSAPLDVPGVLGDIAPLATGEVDVYWWKSDFEMAWILYERVSPELEPGNELFTTEPFPVSNQFVELAATVAGTGPVFLHTQVDDTPEATGISRLFVRQTPGPRRRAVR